MSPLYVTGGPIGPKLLKLPNAAEAAAGDLAVRYLTKSARGTFPEVWDAKRVANLDSVQFAHGNDNHASALKADIQVRYIPYISTTQLSYFLLLISPTILFATPFVICHVSPLLPPPRVISCHVSTPSATCRSSPYRC